MQQLSSGFMPRNGAFPSSYRGTLPQGQGNQGIRTTTAGATSGGTVTVNVGPNDPSVQVTNNSNGSTSNAPTNPGKDTPVPIPNAPGGTFITISVGTGLRARIIIVEVIAPGP